MAKNRKLGKTTAQRKAMLRTQVTDLLVNEKITTTLARAKETQAIANSLIALAIKEKDNFEMEDKKIVRAKRDTNGNKVTELVKSKNGNEYLKVVKEEVVPKKKVNFTIVFLLVFILVVAMFFFFNPEVINGKNVYYTCSKSYDHEKLPASVIENVELEFNGHGTIIDIKVKSDYIFNDVNYYKEFRDKSYFYQYFSDGDTYKFDDNTYTYKLFSSINTKEDFFLPTNKDGLIKHYQDDNYTCKVVDN